MRHAPDPRVLLDVATVQLTSEQVGDDVGALVARIQRLERQLADGVPAAGRSDGSVAVALPPPAAARGCSGRSVHGANQARLPGRCGAPSPPARSDRSARCRRRAASRASSSAARHRAACGCRPPALPAPPSRRRPRPSGGGPVTAADWETVRPTLRGMARAVFSPATLVASAAGSVTLGLAQRHPPHEMRTAPIRRRAGAGRSRRAPRSPSSSSSTVAVRVRPARVVAVPVAAASRWSLRSYARPTLRRRLARRSRDDPAASMSAGALAHDTAPQAATDDPRSEAQLT